MQHEGWSRVGAVVRCVVLLLAWGLQAVPIPQPVAVAWRLVLYLFPVIGSADCV